jgi:tripartite ATP-independent transporter DctM subunit
MSNTAIGILVIAVLLILLFLRVWLGVAMGVSAFVGLLLLADSRVALNVVGIEPLAQTMVYALSCVPLFILMGVLIANTGMGDTLFDCAAKWIGQIKGGLAIASVAACGVFAAVCGSSMATAVTMGKVAFPQMKRMKYNESMAVGCLAAGGSVGIMIPPSLAFIMYGLLTQESIGHLFLAGIIPGLLQVAFYCVLIFATCRLRPEYGPASPHATMKARVQSLPGALPVLLLIVVVIGGIYGGIFTATEAGAIGSCAAIVIAFLFKKLSRRNLLSSLRETSATTGMILLLIVGSFIFMRFLTLSGMPATMSAFANGLTVPRWVVLLVIIVVYLILGCLMDVYSAIVLTLPITYPLMEALGYDMIWFGVILVKLIELGEITPPVGINVFVLARSCNVRPEIAFRGIVPFVISDLILLATLCAFPDLPLLLVRSSQASLAAL